MQRADAICSAYDAKVKLLTRPSSYDDIAAYVERTLPYYVAALDRLEALKPPVQDEAGVRAWLAANRKIVDAVRSLRDAALRHDPAGANDAASAVQSAGVTSRQSAAALGLKVCSLP